MHVSDSFLSAVSHNPGLHIPDGFLSLPIALFSWGIAIALIALAVRQTQSRLDERRVPLIGVMAAFIFAAQMINFPVAGGTSGHLLGGTLAAITLGPWAGILVMTSVIVVQGLLFQDGGLVVMGANILNMGLLTTLIGYGLFRGVIRQRRGVRLTVAGIAAWLSVIAGALFTSLELWLSGTSALRVVVPTMLSVHALIGIGEALITVAALAFILRTRPDVLETLKQVVPSGRAVQDPTSSPQGTEEEALGSRGWVVASLVATLVVVLLSPVASANPDGLERVAIDLGFINKGSAAPYQIIPDYAIPFLGETALSTILAGLIGAVVVIAVAIAVMYLLRRPTRSTS